MDDVVNELCNPNQLLESRPHTRPPEPVILERIIRDNAIDGSVLLLHTDMASLKAIGITKLGERSALLWITDQLRAQSFQYRIQVAVRLSESSSRARSQASAQLSEMFSSPQTPATTLAKHDRQLHEHLSLPPFAPPERPLEGAASTRPVEQAREISRKPIQGHT